MQIEVSHLPQGFDKIKSFNTYLLEKVTLIGK